MKKQKKGVTRPSVSKKIRIELNVNEQHVLLTMIESTWQGGRLLFVPRSEALLDAEIEYCGKHWRGVNDHSHVDPVIMAPVYRQLLSTWTKGGEVAVSYSATREEFRRALKAAQKGGR